MLPPSGYTAVGISYSQLAVIVPYFGLFSLTSNNNNQISTTIRGSNLTEGSSIHSIGDFLAFVQSANIDPYASYTKNKDGSATATGTGTLIASTGGSFNVVNDPKKANCTQLANPAKCLNNDVGALVPVPEATYTSGLALLTLLIASKKFLRKYRN